MISLLAGALATASSLLATGVPGPDYPDFPPMRDATVTGRIVDAALGEPLEFATVSAYAADSALVGGASTDSTGGFSLALPLRPRSGQAPASYRLRLEFIGYRARDTTLVLTGDVDLGTLALASDAVALDGATVTAQRSQLTLKLDRQIFDVAADITSRGGSANDVLENVPSVDVSPEGVVSLRGNSGVKVA